MNKRGTRVPTLNINKKFLPKSKRSQVFLITAVIFIAIISTLITIKNYSKKTEFSSFPYIAEEIQIESEKVMDYALVNDKWNEIDDFTQNVSNYVKKEDIDIYFITGDSESSSCYTDAKPCTITKSDKITATIGQVPNQESYEFPLYQEGKHFYFIMIKEKEDRGEKYVYTNA